MKKQKKRVTAVEEIEMLEYNEDTGKVDITKRSGKSSNKKVDN